MEHENRGRMFFPLLLVGLGVYFLLREANIIPDDFNWWAFFILIPGLMILWNAVKAYNRAGSFTSNVTGQAVVGGIITLVGAAFLFDIGLGFMSNLWPLLLIAGGVALLLRQRE